MKPMTGEIGTWLLEGRQIGGFKAWTVLIFKQPVLHTIVKASGYWAFEIPKVNKFLTQFYVLDTDNNLNLILEKKMIVSFPPIFDLDTFILSSLEMRFEEDFDWRNL